MAPTNKEVAQVVDFLKREQDQRLAAFKKTKDRFLRASLGAVFASSLALIAMTDQGSNILHFLKSPKQPVIVIAHGGNGNPDSGLVGALKRQLEEERLLVFAPQLPLSNEQTLDNWESSLSNVAEKAQKEGPVILVGYSAGGSAVLHLIDGKPSNSYCGVLAISTALEGNMPRMYRPFKYPKEIMGKVNGNAGLIHSRSDTTLHFEKAVALSVQTGIPFLRQDVDGGHFTNLGPEALKSKATLVSAYVQEVSRKCQGSVKEVLNSNQFNIIGISRSINFISTNYYNFISSFN